MSPTKYDRYYDWWSTWKKTSLCEILQSSYGCCQQSQSTTSLSEHTLRKLYKWYRKLALRLFSQVILIACKVYLAHTGSNIVFLDFMRNMVASLLASTPKIIIPDVQIPHDTYACLTGRYFPQIKKPAPDASDQRPTKQCHACNTCGL